LNYEARCETTCSGYRVCFKACPSGAVMPGSQNLLCVCRDGLVRSYQGNCVPRQSCFNQQQHFFGSFGNNGGFGNTGGFGGGSFGSSSNFGSNSNLGSFGGFGTRPLEGSGTTLTPRMKTETETTGHQAASEKDHQTVEPENPFDLARRHARMLAAKRRS